mgnify:CR=1 FL=1
MTAPFPLQTCFRLRSRIRAALVGVALMVSLPALADNLPEVQKLIKQGQYPQALEKVDVYLAGKKSTGPQSPKLARQIWDIWLGYHPVSPQLRVSLVNRLEVLGK